MNSKQFYYVQRGTLILAVILIMFGYTGANGVFSFLKQSPDVFFYPQLIIAFITTAGAHLFMMALGAQQLKSPKYSISKLLRLMEYYLLVLQRLHSFFILKRLA